MLIKLTANQVNMKNEKKKSKIKIELIQAQLPPMSSEAEFC